MARYLDSAESISATYYAGIILTQNKLGTDNNILKKPGKLTPEEFEHIKQL